MAQDDATIGKSVIGNVLISMPGAGAPPVTSSLYTMTTTGVGK